MTVTQKIFSWLKAIYIKPVAAVAIETQTSEVRTLMTNKIAITLLKNSVPADGISQNQIKIVVTNDAGTPVFGATVNLSVSQGTIQSSGVTDASGTLVVPVTSNTVGQTTVTATTDDGGQGIDGTLYFVSVLTSAQEIKSGVQDFEAAYKFVVSGIGQLGDAAEDELKVLVKKYL
jgi:hypothetical protein